MQNAKLRKKTNVLDSQVFVEAEKFFEQMRDFSHSVAQRAYEFFEARGCDPGHEQEDWFRAETELMRSVPLEIIEGDEQIIVRVETPGFAVDEVHACVESNRLMLSSAASQSQEIKPTEKVYSEFLPAEIEPANATAVLKDGILELKLTKTPKPDAVNIEVKSV
jgi:HSP20 family molecular chaperone IbpA